VRWATWRSLAARSQAPQLWERLGYASTLSQSVALWYFPVSLAGPLFIDRARFGGSWTMWIAISVVAQLVLMASFEICRRMIHRPGRARSQPARTLIAILAATFLRGLSLGLLVMWFGFSSSTELGYRLLAGLNAMAMIVVIALAISARDRHRELIGSLDRERASLAELDISMQGRLAEITRGITSLVTAKVEPMLDDLDEVLNEVAGGADVDLGLQSLRHLVDDELRPLSHQLSLETVDLDVLAVPVARVDRIRVPMPEYLSIRQALLPGTSAAVTMICALAPAVRQLSAAGMLVFVLGLGALVLLGVGAICRVAGGLRLPVLVCIGTVSLAVSLTLAMGIVLMEWAGLPVPEHVVIPGLIIGAAIGAGTATYSAVDERRAVTQAQLLVAVQELQSSVSRLRQQAWIGRRRVSYILHGSVQSALHAASMRLSANPRPDPALIAEIRSDISKAMGKLGATSERPALVNDALAETADLWREACSVEWAVSPAAHVLMTRNATAAECALEIVREGVGNAIRHGRASHVNVGIEARSSHLLIAISDDGRADGHEAQRGLGSRMLDEMCVSWSRESDDCGTTLTAELAT
jgi:signal transduction histidine kinase